jgi:DNA-binding response OmpR family regulator
MPQKILLIDDDQYIREMYEEVLKNESYEVETAVDGKAGLEKIMNGGYDLILLDIMLPYIDGIGILTQLQKSKPKKINGPIILLTNLAADPVIKEAIQMGAVACLSKAEMDPGEFIKKVKEIIK